jgi:purine-nucleoside phosphorylase
MDPHSTLHSRASTTIHTLRGLVPKELAEPKVAIVCGSGLGGLARTVEEKSKVEVQYSEVPGFPVSTGMYLARSHDN